jgi:DNA-binding NtrC family response regulator
MPSSISILVVGGEPTHEKWLVANISSFGLQPVSCGTFQRAAGLLRKNSFSIVFCDDVLPDGTFRMVMDYAARYGMPMPVIVTSRRDDWDLFLKALNVEAFDYIAFPPLPGEFERIMRSAHMECRRSAGVTEELQGSIMQSAACDHAVYGMEK